MGYLVSDTLPMATLYLLPRPYTLYLLPCPWLHSERIFDLDYATSGIWSGHPPGTR
jgi:hypothetical protein